jgi:hypothetical protein
MQQPSRRQFVAASLAGLPMLAHASSAPAVQRAGASGDPVLDQTVASLRELVVEGEAKPGSRKEIGRAIEATLGLHAAHVAANYDARIQRALKLAEARLGRAALVEQVLRHAHHQGRHGITHDAVEATLTKLGKHGYAGSVRDLQKALRAARLQSADGLRAVTLTGTQYDFCTDVKWMIELAELAAGIICMIAAMEPTFALEPFCIAAQANVLAYKAMQWWWC